MYSKTPALLPIPGINWRNQTVITRNPAPSYAESGTRVKLSHGDFAGASTVEASVSLRSSLSYSMIRTQNEAIVDDMDGLELVLATRHLPNSNGIYRLGRFVGPVAGRAFRLSISSLS
jgi:hypothetical protein